MSPYTYVWEFFIAPAARASFESAYGPDGVWVKLFRNAAGFIETILLRDTSNSLRYVTIDRWTSADAHASFRSKFSAQYEAIDRHCQEFTTCENLIGEFTEGP
jgi:heme-degrading monooxygenase HmoA